jgi:lysyl-tRNA synthetase class 2
VAGIPIQAASLLAFSSGSVQYSDALDWLPTGIGFTGLGVLLACAYLIFRPLAAVGGLPEPMLRRKARRIVRAHGADSLSFFKLRQDNHYFFDSEREAFVAYRIERGVLLVSGDPVGPRQAIPRIVRELCAFAEVRSIKVAVVGASAGFAEIAEGAGLRSFYMGDEAIIDVDRFSLEGRAIRKVRQSLSRLRKEGYTAEGATLVELDARDLDQLDLVSEQWLAGGPERGFSMAMDGLRADHLADSTVLVARDRTGMVRGFLHFVPARGGAVMSLSAMRRDPGTPNGLTEFMVVEAVRLLGASGAKELSLNFAAFARLLHTPGGRRDRVLATLLRLAGRHFQIESLYRFNAKFLPRWQERYLLYDGALGLPRAGLATLMAEGQLPKPRLPAGWGTAARRFIFASSEAAIIPPLGGE